MGFNLQSAHHSGIWEGNYSEQVAAALQAELGNAVPLGQPGSDFCIPDEMGWSWWSKLQRLGLETLGDSGSRQLRAVDAWGAVYVDLPVERAVVWPLGRPSAAPARSAKQVPTRSSGWIGRIRRALGLGPKASDSETAARTMLYEMIEELGARGGERDAIQVGSLPRVIEEAETLLRGLKVKCDPASVEALRQSYSEDKDRCDDDPAVQCLCHLWLTGTHALEHGQPLWLIK